MPFKPPRHCRRSIRLPNYDYTQPGYYFVTICTHDGQSIFADQRLRAIAESQWRDPRRLPLHTNIDAWVVMDDHVHAIIVIRGERDNARNDVHDVRDVRDVRHPGGAQRAPASLPPDELNEIHRKPALIRSMVALAAPLRDNDDGDRDDGDTVALAAPPPGQR